MDYDQIIRQHALATQHTIYGQWAFGLTVGILTGKNLMQRKEILKMISITPDMKILVPIIDSVLVVCGDVGGTKIAVQ
jgi:hypothetical protein